MTAETLQLARQPGDRTPLEMFDRAVAVLGDRPLIYSFDKPIAARRVAELVDALAVGLGELGVCRGDRVALHLQNDPQFMIAMLAAWRLGAIAVPCSPMLRDRELAKQLIDSTATTLITLEQLYRGVGTAATEMAGCVKHILRTDPMLWAGGASSAASDDLVSIAERHLGTTCPRLAIDPDDVAVLTYTSGTTGPAKGAMNTHANIAHASLIYRDCLSVAPTDTILGIAPLYHVTGLSGHIGLAIAAGAPLVLAHRFDPSTTCKLIERHRTTVAIAAITAYIAIANDGAAQRHDLSSMRAAYSGGAPIPPAAVSDISARTGLEIRPVYGLTETTGPTHLCPPGRSAPVHNDTGALSVGIAVPELAVRIVDDAGEPLTAGAIGEVALRGPQVVPGYWHQPEETKAAFPGGELRTGDIGIVDDDGWLYLVDRRKDLIIASGFKVWPREVEDVLYEHEAVREAAVIGVPDSYRGETVWAYVSLKSGCQAEAAELVAHCRTKLAAHKYPRVVQILDELPKTQSGKILRRELRNVANSSQP